MDTLTKGLSTSSFNRSFLFLPINIHNFLPEYVISNLNKHRHANFLKKETFIRLTLEYISIIDMK